VNQPTEGMQLTPMKGLIDDEPVLAFVGQGVNHYGKAFQRIGKGKLLTLNVGALLFGPMWLLNRKMYLYFVIAILLMSLIAKISWLYFNIQPFSVQIMFGHLFLCFVADRIYFRFYKKIYRQSGYGLEGADRIRALEYLSAKGGMLLRTY